MARRNKEQETADRALARRFCFAHGSPWVMLSDNGLEFKNASAKRVATLFNVRQRLTTPSHPQAIGLPGRTHGVIANIFGETQQGDLALRDVRLPESAFWKRGRWEVAVRSSVRQILRRARRPSTYARR